MGKQSKLDLLADGASNFSLLNSSDNSQVLASSDSDFVPSEPPDIRNWFSSYAYESPALNSGENLEVFGRLRGTDCEKDGHDVEENNQEKEGNLVKLQTPGKRNELVVKKRVASKGFVRCKNSVGINNLESQVLAASDSTFLPSEPPDIRNWFLSYAYESPELNSEENLEVCGSLRGNECEKDGYDVEENNHEKEENLEKLQTLGKRAEFVVDERVASKGFVSCKNFVGNNNFEIQGLDSSDSLLSSEYNIKNWFSSYVYESPALSTSENFGFSDFKESEADKDRFNGEKRSKRNAEDLVSEKTTSNKCNSSDENKKHQHQPVYKGDHGLVGNKNSSVLDDLPLKTISKETVGAETSENHVGNSTKKVEKPSLNNKNSTGRKFPLETTPSSSSPKITSGTNSGKSPRKSIQRTDSTENTLKTESEAIVMNGKSMRETCRGTEKENDGNRLAVDGFILMKKSKSIYDENCSKGPVGAQFKSLKSGVTVSSAGNKNGILRRKVLSERTNFQHTDVLGVTGKWRCPQKSKPNLGPPLKQLRLEQWVHRV
ncbi:hypothetical protein LguiA_015399 [Lonicera macranthoides]